MNLFAWISLIVSISCALLAIFTFLQAKNRTHWVWGIFNLNVSLWCLGLFLVGVAQSAQAALFYWRLTLVPNTFISIFLYHLIYSLCQLKEKRLLILIYLQGILFAIISLFYKPFLAEVDLIFNRIYFAKATPLISLWLSVFSFITGIAFYRILQFVRTAYGEKKTQALYLFWGMLVGFGGGFTIALPLYGVPIYPAWHFLICIYAGIFTFSILRHHFLDIRGSLIRLLIPVFIFTAILFVFSFTYFDMNLFSVASLSVAILCALLAFIVFAYSTKKVHRIWAIFNVIVAAWGLANFCAGMSATPEKALMFWRLVCLVCTFLSVVYYHVIAEFCGIKRPRMLSFAYIQGALFVPLIIFSDYFISSTFYAFDSIHYYKATILFTVWAAMWFIITGSAFVELYKFIKRSKGVEKTQALYMFWAPLLGHSGGAITILPAFNLPIYPAWHFSVCVYAAIMTYAMFRYQLMDIRIAVTRLGVFVVVYSLILGIPFGLAILGKPWLMGFLGENWFWIPMFALLVLATAGPSIFIYLQHRAENAILQEERRVQQLLKNASRSMSTIRDLQKLLGLIVDVLAKNLHLDYAGIYLFENNEGKYVLKAAEPGTSNGKAILNSNSPLIQRLKDKKYPILYDEMNHLVDNQKGKNGQVQEIIHQMQDLSASVIVPAIKEDMLIGFIVMGKRREKESYSAELIDTLGVIGDHAASNIENAMYFEAENRRLEEEGKNVRRMHLDTMVSTIAHEINNPMHIIDGEMGALHQILQENLMPMEQLLPLAMKKTKKVRGLAQGVALLVNNIRNFSKGQIHIAPLKIEDFLDSASVFIKHELKEHPDIKYTVNIQSDLPLIIADSTMAIEILTNFISNAIHATRRNTGAKEVVLNIHQLNAEFVRVEVVDNGYGIDPDTKKKLFETTYTSKSHTEGTGLGLWRIRKVCEFLRATYGFDSPGRDAGARFWVDFRIAEG